jgi:hypothetical protein
VTSWKEVLSAGQGVGYVRAIEPVAVIVERLEQQYKSTVIETDASSVRGLQNIGG